MSMKSFPKTEFHEQIFCELTASIKLDSLAGENDNFLNLKSLFYEALIVFHIEIFRNSNNLELTAKVLRSENFLVIIFSNLSRKYHCLFKCKFHGTFTLRWFELGWKSHSVWWPVKGNATCEILSSFYVLTDVGIDLPTLWNAADELLPSRIPVL